MKAIFVMCDLEARRSLRRDDLYHTSILKKDLRMARDKRRGDVKAGLRGKNEIDADKGRTDGKRKRHRGLGS